MQKTWDPNDFPLPEWALKRSDGTYMELGAQLSTRDGRRCGNAFVNGLRVIDNIGAVADVVTDAGSKMTMTLAELKEVFYPPVYMMNLIEARVKFCPPGNGCVPDRINDLEIYKFDSHGHNAPAYGCNHHGDNSGEYFRVEDVRQALKEDPHATLESIKQAIWKYHNALDTRQHGGVAAGNCVDQIQDILNMPWERGATLETRLNSGC